MAVCLLTIHGIGFQHAPDDAQDIAGYADGLHDKLVKRLGPAFLGDDPERRDRDHDGDRGPVYVSSEWPPASGNIADGLARLDPGRPLAPAGSRAAHVALIYCGLESTARQPLALSQTVERGAFSVGQYATVRGAVSMLFHDITAALKPGPPGQGQLRVRDDANHGHHPFLTLAGLVTRHPTQDPSGPFTVLRNVEDDVAAYVCRNDLRQRVRDFVRQALVRLAQRGDVDRIVVNAHSQGTVVAFDVVREAEDDILARIPWLITAGSPLRKYADTLAWGVDVGGIRAIPNWLNAWDALDPVADPLAQGPKWKRGQPLEIPPPGGLFLELDDRGNSVPAKVVDCQVDNVKVVPGTGLRAHDYWGDDPYFVAPLAAVLQDVAGAGALTAAEFGDHFDQRELAAAGAGANGAASPPDTR